MEDEEKVLNNKWTEEYFVVVETNNTASCLILRELYQFSTIAIWKVIIFENMLPNWMHIDKCFIRTEQSKH